MRIAIWHNLSSGGAKRALHDHVAALKSRGHYLEAWCPPTADRSYLPLERMIEEHVVELRWRPVAQGSLFAEALKLFSHRQRLAALDRHSAECVRQIECGGFDILYAHCCVFTRAPFIARHTTLPSVLYLQEPNRMLYEALPQLPWAALPRPTTVANAIASIPARARDAARIRLYRTLAREELQNAAAFDRILVNSYYSRESVLRAYGLDARVCYLGVDTDRFRRTRTETGAQTCIVSVGALIPEKNAEFVLEAVGQVGRRPINLVWVANIVNREYQRQLNLTAAKHGIQFDVKERISEANLVETLNRANLIVYAPRLEPFGYIPLEANACGKAVVAVAEGGVRETIVHNVNGMLVDHDTGSVARAIEGLLDNPGKRRALGAAGRRMAVANWNLSRATDNIERQLLDIARVA
jgi:glycosyltransferase involved in cell wall biosynthesis